jgi:hypothetical protein
MAKHRFFGAQRLLTMTFKLEGSEVQDFTFRPEKVNVLPEELFQFLNDKKREGSKRKGGQKISPLDEWFEAGLLWELSPEQAEIFMQAGRAPQPLDPMAGQNRHSHQLEAIPGQTAAEKEIADRIMASQGSAMPVDTISAPSVKAPPAPVVT